MQASIICKESLFWNQVIKWKEEVKLIASSCAPQDIPHILKGIAWLCLCQAGENNVCSIAPKGVYQNGPPSKERCVHAHIYVPRHVYRLVCLYKMNKSGLCISACKYIHLLTWYSEGLLRYPNSNYHTDLIWKQKELRTLWIFLLSKTQQEAQDHCYPGFSIIRQLQNTNYWC